MATDSTLQKIADNLLAQFDKEEYYRKSLEALPVGENTLNNLGYSLYKQRKFKEAQSVFEDCLRQNRDVRYAANNLVRTLLAQGKKGEAQRVIQEHERFVSKDLKRRAEKPVGKVKNAVPEPAVTDVEAETIVDIGVKKQQFSSEKLLEDELVQRMEIGIPVFGMPLRIYQKRGVYGRQFVLRNGRLDILGIDTAGDLYVIELKKDSGYDDAYAQTREYIDWIEEDVAVKGQRVFGIICLLIITDGACDRLNLRGRKHAYLMPWGSRLPFVPKAPVFRLK